MVVSNLVFIPKVYADELEGEMTTNNELEVYTDTATPPAITWNNNTINVMASDDTYVQGGKDAAKTGADLLGASDMLRIKTSNGADQAFSRKVVFKFDLTNLNNEMTSFELKWQAHTQGTNPRE